MDREENYMEICGNLEKIIQKIGEPLEGNCVYRHNSLEPWDCLRNKRVNYQKIAGDKTNICEIGFNAGHSILSMLLVNQKAKYTLFDLGIHGYSRPCLDYIKSIFPNTVINVIWGDSTITLPQYILQNPAEKFDLIHIDGGHSFEIYSKDWINSMSIISDNGIIIFDDTDNKKISAFIDERINNGEARELSNYLETFGYQHRILSKAK